MTDFNKTLEPGDYQNGVVNTVIEIPKGSTMKIEYDSDKASFTLDRVEPAIFAKPVNYGFIPGTLDEDGDPLDTIVITEEPLTTGVWLKAKIIGMLDFEDDGENDHKIIVVPADDRQTGDSIKSLDDLSDQLKHQVEHHFNHYKDLKKPGSTKVRGWVGIEQAKKTIAESIARAK
jgi:inorganic pyrophosphatase